MIRTLVQEFVLRVLVGLFGHYFITGRDDLQGLGRRGSDEGNQCDAGQAPSDASSASPSPMLSQPTLTAQIPG